MQPGPIEYQCADASRTGCTSFLHLLSIKRCLTDDQAFTPSGLLPQRSTCVPIFPADVVDYSGFDRP
jgi:hypothetical protein